VCRRSRERISESCRWGRRSFKQLSDTVTERKNLLPNSDLRAERDCIPAYAHTESYGISYTISCVILRALFCKDSSFWDCATVKPWCQTTQPYFLVHFKLCHVRVKTADPNICREMKWLVLVTKMLNMFVRFFLWS